MSGSGGGNFDVSFGGAAASCEDLVIITQIASPKMDVLQGVATGDILDVSLSSAGNITVVVIKRNGQIAGGVASLEVQRLRECLQSGTCYEARVIAVNGPQVNVRITAI